MRVPSTLFQLSFIIIAISGIKCNFDEKLKCFDLESKCENNTECCSQNCQWSLMNMFRKSCRPSVMVDDLRAKVQMPKNVRVLCRLLNDTELSKEMSEQLFKKFRMNASYSKLPPNTIVEVTHGRKSEFVQINDFLPVAVDPNVFYLSKNAAEALNVTSDDGEPCELQAPQIRRHTPREQWIVYGIFGVVALTLLFPRMFAVY